jgi:hypothetical protein
MFIAHDPQPQVWGLVQFGPGSQQVQNKVNPKPDPTQKLGFF